ncbi:MAG: hypothetical protein KKB38_20250 [Gammaproteobacteria bacterium]|nr:hypothetical protein [Gammaproteobacteria bacterium]
MARGAPDYSNVRVESLLTRLDDLAELVARLGGAYAFDRSGSVIMLHDFGYGLALAVTDTAGLGEMVEASSLYSLFGGYTVCLNRVADASSESSIYVQCPLYGSAKLGVQALFVPATAVSVISVQITRFTGLAMQTWALMWDGYGEVVYYLDDADEWIEAQTNMGMFVDNPTYNMIKLVVDPATDEYVRAVINGTAIILTDVASQSEASSKSSHVEIMVKNGPGLEDASDVYVDAIIVTTNEP